MQHSTWLLSSAVFVETLNLQCVQWLQEELKRPFDFVAAATLSLSLPSFQQPLGRSFLSRSSDVSRDLALCYVVLTGTAGDIARSEQRGAERSGDLIGVTRRGQVLQLWMNF